MTKRTTSTDPHAELFRILRDKSSFFSEERGLHVNEAMEIILALGAAYAAVLDLPEEAFLQVCALIYRDQRREVLAQRRAEEH